MKLKQILSVSLILIFVIFSCGIPVVTHAYVSVHGYTKKNGTYVAPYVRSNPNGLKYDNYGYKPSQGLYNNSYGTKDSTWDTPTYVTDPNYYEGKALYDAGQTGNLSNSLTSYSNTSSASIMQTSCSTGYYLDNDGSCSKITVPLYGYATGNTTGSWDCVVGYTISDDRMSCRKIIIPEHSRVIGSTPGSWSCLYGYTLGPDRRSCK